jgi:predicted nucleic acid-binding protein
VAAAKPKIVYWKPGGVVRGTQVYLDANFLVGLARPDHIWHASASALRDSLAERGTKLVLSSLAFNEVIYQLLRLEQKDSLQTEEEPALTTNWPERLDEATLSLPNLSFFEPPDAAFQRQVIRAVYELKLDPTDAFHYAAARRLACPIVTNDVGFQKIPDQNLTIITFF